VQVNEVGQGEPWFNTAESRMLRALAALGWDLGDLWGVAWGRENPEPFSEQIRETYEKLSMTLGPERVVQAESRLRRWAPPLAWYNESLDNPESPIEDPEARPDGYPYQAPSRRVPSRGLRPHGTSEYNGRPVSEEDRKKILALILGCHTLKEIMAQMPHVTRGSIQDVRMSIPGDQRPVVHVNKNGVRKVFIGQYNHEVL
jgi:hypothetical protein